MMLHIQTLNVADTEPGYSILLYMHRESCCREAQRCRPVSTHLILYTVVHAVDTTNVGISLVFGWIRASEKSLCPRPAIRSLVVTLKLIIMSRHVSESGHSHFGYVCTTRSTLPIQYNPNRKYSDISMHFQ